MSETNDEFESLCERWRARVEDLDYGPSPAYEILKCASELRELSDRIVAECFGESEAIDE
jgi:hypothetical protein